MWGQALNAAGVSTESEFWAPNKVYYLPALHLAPTLPQPLIDPSFAPLSSSTQPDHDPSPTSAKGKEKKKELPPLANVQVVEAEEEVAEVAQLKRKKKERVREKGNQREGANNLA